jgi:hypothetical protein
MLRKSCLLMGLAAVMTVAGCGPSLPAGAKPTHKTTVTVTYKGAPVEGATITFLGPESTTAVGMTDAQGKAKMKTYVEGDGAIEGQHKVLISKVETVGGAPAADQDSPNYVPPVNVPPPQVKYHVPQKYEAPGTSGLTADVKSGPNEITFELKD